MMTFLPVMAFPSMMPFLPVTLARVTLTETMTRVTRQPMTGAYVMTGFPVS